MINGFLAQWVGYGKLLTNAHRSWILNFAMAGNRASSLSGWVVINGVFGAFAQQETPVIIEMANQIGAFQTSRHRNFDFFPSNAASWTRLSVQSAIRFQ